MHIFVLQTSPTKDFEDTCIVRHKRKWCAKILQSMCLHGRRQVNERLRYLISMRILHAHFHLANMYHRKKERVYGASP